MNMTISVPFGTTDHGTENLICSPAEWTDYIIFFAINYMAHAFTLMSRPGETMSERVSNITLEIPQMWVVTLLTIS